MFIVENLETVEGYNEEIKISSCYHLTSQCKHFGAFPSEFSSLLLVRVTDSNSLGPIRKHEQEKRTTCGKKEKSAGNFFRAGVGGRVNGNVVSVLGSGGGEDPVVNRR